MFFCPVLTLCLAGFGPLCPFIRKRGFRGPPKRVVARSGGRVFDSNGYLALFIQNTPPFGGLETTSSFPPNGRVILLGGDTPQIVRLKRTSGYSSLVLQFLFDCRFRIAAEPLLDVAAPTVQITAVFCPPLSGVFFSLLGGHFVCPFYLDYTR